MSGATLERRCLVALRWRCAALLVASASLVRASDGPAPWSGAEEGSPATLSALVAMELTLAAEDRREHGAAAQRRVAVSAQLDEFHRALDALLAGTETGVKGRVAELQELLRQAEGERAVAVDRERVVAERLFERLRRIELLKGRLDAFAATEPRSAGVLAGAWDLVLLPAAQRGSCVLSQSGTLVTGTYTLEGGFSGSLQGTLVNRKVVLERIDSRLGRSMELEGQLSSDGKTIRGTWLDYELAGRSGSTGQWVAHRRAASEP